MHLQYNYVFFGSDWDLYMHSYSDLMNTSYSTYIPSPRVVLGKWGEIHKLHFSSKLNSMIKLPLKELWNTFYFSPNFNDGKQICFVFFWNWAVLADESNYFDFLKHRFKGCKIVLFLQDLVDGRLQVLKKFVDKFDLVLSFDHGDCKTYGFVYHPLVFSPFNGEISDMPYSDVYFLGQPKNRLDEIMSIYNILISSGLKVDMNLVNVPVEKQILNSGINYINWMSYEDNLQHVLHSKCILEVMQKHGRGFTQRCLEAVGLNRMLLTNNPEIKSSQFYNSQMMCQFNDSMYIDHAFVQKIKDFNYCETKSYADCQSILPVELLRFIDENISA